METKKVFLCCILGIIAIGLVFGFGCSKNTNEINNNKSIMQNTTAPVKETNSTNLFSSIEMCKQTCLKAKSEGKNLNNGPCLLDPYPNDPKIVCDVAHSPRESVDEISQNQCQSFLEGRATKFVEVTPDCKMIRAK